MVKFAGYAQTTVGGALKPGKHGHERALAGAGSTEQRNDFAIADVQIDTAQDINRRIIAAESKGEVSGGNCERGVGHNGRIRIGVVAHKETADAKRRLVDHSRPFTGAAAGMHLPKARRIRVRISMLQKRLVPVMGPKWILLRSAIACSRATTSTRKTAILPNCRTLCEQGGECARLKCRNSGDTSAAGLQRFAFTLDAQDQEPELVIIELGGNDLLRGLPEQTKAISQR